jgi:hypothetical protein
MKEERKEVKAELLSGQIGVEMGHFRRGFGQLLKQSSMAVISYNGHIGLYLHDRTQHCTGLASD